MINLKKKLAFVLGGSGLIGKSVIKKLEGLGCKTLNLDIKDSKKSKYDYLKFDCTNIKDLENFSKITKKYGTPDIFINCAYPKTQDWNKNNFKDIKFKSLKKNLEMQLTTSTYLVKEVAENSRKKKKKCSIVLLSSIYGIVGQDNSIYNGTNTTENLTYSVSKGALINLTKQMCSYYSKYGIRVNNVCPGGVIDHERKQKTKNYIKLVRNYSKRCPTGRMATPEEIADPIIFLASDNANYISGASLIVDGGWTSI